MKFKKLIFASIIFGFFLFGLALIGGSDLKPSVRLFSILFLLILTIVVESHILVEDGEEVF